MMTRKSSFIALVCLVTLVGLVSLAGAANEVFLSNDTAESEVTYVVQFESGVKGNIDKIRVTLPPGSNAANAALGRLFIGDKGFEGDDEHKKDVQLSLDGPDTVVIDLKDDRSVKVGTKILVELFNLNNPVAGNYVIDVSTIGKKGNVLEVIPSIGYSTFPVGPGDITAVNTPAGSGLTGGAASGDVNLSLQVCAAGQVLKSLGSTWVCAADNDTDTNSGGTVTSVGTGSGLTGGPITTTGTVAIAAGGVTSAHIADGSIGSADVNSAQIQLRVTSSCPAGQSIRQINFDGTVVCEVDDAGAGGVTTVTASAPLTSSGGATPNISLPNVKIQSTNTAIGTSALLFNTTGVANTASGVQALHLNTTGNSNTASGVNALPTNTTGNSNTAIGSGADVSAGNLTNATAIGANAIVSQSNSLVLGNNAKVGIGTSAPNEQLEITGNLRLPTSTATTGIIKSGANRFIHNFGTNNFFAGVNAGNFSMTGAANTATGASALQNNTIGFDNTASGVEALRNNTEGDSNTASGRGALFSNTTGSLNTAIGLQALRENTTGDFNIAVGPQALRDNTIGGSNTAVGISALLTNTSGFSNTASGDHALVFNTTGFNNTASGDSALFNNTTGHENTAIGTFADLASGNLTNATAIGANAIVNASNKIRLGDANVTVVESTGTFTQVSDKNQKENFKPVDGEEVLKKIRDIPAQSWNFIGHDPEKFRHYGPMAQDFFAAFGNDGVGTIGTPTTINSGDMAGILMIAVQALEKQNREMKGENTDLKSRLDALEQLLKNKPYVTTAWAEPLE